MSHVMRKPGCSITKDGKRLVISDLGSRRIVLYMKRSEIRNPNQNIMLMCIFSSILLMNMLLQVPIYTYMSAGSLSCGSFTL